MNALPLLGALQPAMSALAIPAVRAHSQRLASFAVGRAFRAKEGARPPGQDTCDAVIAVLSNRFRWAAAPASRPGREDRGGEASFFRPLLVAWPFVSGNRNGVVGPG
jgi:hypothetical protein